MGGTFSRKKVDRLIHHLDQQNLDPAGITRGETTREIISKQNSEPISESIDKSINELISEPISELTTKELENSACMVSELKLHSRRNCLVLDAEEMVALQQAAVSVSLEPGTHLIQLRSSSLPDQSAHQPASQHLPLSQNEEPWVMLWIYGGKVVNQKNGISVEATWSTLNGWDDTLTLEVIKPATLCAFFLKTNRADDAQEVEIAIVQI
jgi:hypothetical protein